MVWKNQKKINIKMLKIRGILIRISNKIKKLKIQEKWNNVPRVIKSKNLNVAFLWFSSRIEVAYNEIDTAITCLTAL